jgi:hypothetical protein
MTDTILILVVAFIAVLFAYGALWHGFEHEQ